MGKGIVDKLKEEYDIEDEWVSYEIHPETPLAGVPLDERMGAERAKEMVDRLRSYAEPYGLTFADITTLPNSRISLQASEFARDHGKFHEFHDWVFKEYFAEGKNIGDIEVLLDIAIKIGLDPQEMRLALEEDRYENRLKAGADEGEQLKVTGTPTFLINGHHTLVGAHPLDTFRKLLKEIEQEKS